jgi:putative hemin transport protein
MTPLTAADSNYLKTAWAKLSGENPGLRIREAAEALGVSEAELLATRTGETVTRLAPLFPEILREFHALGCVMALTRNDAIVHERKGEYKNVEIIQGHGKMGLAVNEDIDLRIFFSNWHFAFAVTSESPRGALHSFQFFDPSGTAVHKVFLQDETYLETFQAIAEKFKSDDQSQTLAVTPKPAKTADKPDAEIDIEGFRAAWAQLKDTHDFFPMLRKFGVGREQALRLAAPEMARTVAAQSYRFILEEAAKRKLPIMVFVGNQGIIQIHTGEVERVAAARGWFNVLDERFNLHIDEDRIARAYVVKKPTADGTVTSLELFNERGENAALFFGKRKPGIPEMEEWKILVKGVASLDGERNDPPV